MEALGSVVVVAGAALVAWRWWLAERRFEVTHRSVQRDEALALYEPRLRALEEALKAQAWARVAQRNG